MATDPLALAGPWRALSSELPLPWLLELDVDGVAVLVTNDDQAGYAWAGPALHADEFTLVCAAAELDRMTASGFRVLLADMTRGTAERPLTWERVAWGGRDPNGRVMPEHADRGLSLGWALRRLGAGLVRLETVERVSAGGGA